MWLPTTKYLQLSLFPQNCVSKNLPLPQIFPLWAISSHIIMIPKPTRIQNSKLQCSMSSPCLKCHVHPNHVIILPPLTLHLWRNTNDVALRQVF